jgi:uncharacterized protein
VHRINRRGFLKRSTLPVASLCFAAQLPGLGTKAASARPAPSDNAPGIIDTNVHLFDWPFRRLKYGGTIRLVQKLREHRIIQAWAGSFEALFHKDVAGVNARLAAACSEHGDGFLLPFGTVNPMWPDWEEDLRKCHEVYRMPGIRLYPSYHGYTLDHPEFARLIRLAADRGMVVQIALEMEDQRVHHPALHAPATNTASLPELLEDVPHARVQLINAFSAMRVRQIAARLAQTATVFDISYIEGTGGVGRLIEGDHWFAPLRWPVERLLFGSHAPFFPLENALLKLFESPLTQEQLTAIMRDNARRLLGEPQICTRPRALWHSQPGRTGEAAHLGFALPWFSAEGGHTPS